MELNNLNVELQRLGENTSALDEGTIQNIVQALQKCESTLLDTLKTKRLAETEDQVGIKQASGKDTAIIIPSKVLDSVCLSRFLTVQECGRVLLLVSKSMLHCYGENHAWEVLCSQQWRNTFSIPDSIVIQRGYNWIFRQLSGPHSFAWPISEPSLTFETSTLLVSIQNSDENEVVSVALQNQQLKKFLTKGELNITLDDKVTVGKFPISDDGELDFVVQRVANWKASLVLFRTDKAECAHIHHTQSCCWGEYDYMDDPNIEDEYQEEKVTMEKVGFSNTVTTVPRPKVDTKLPPLEVDMGYLEFSSSTGLNMTRRGTILEDRIRACSVDDPYVCIKIEPTLICHTQDYCESSKSIDLTSTELRLDIWKQYASGAAELYHSANESKKHGVTLLHLLDAMQDWQ
ncbi:unnamed protein product [Cylindrotheca closterium]|uniref:Uncharacterized protein n=1 Tax=Cylindrotheca closterium TaxID=2856 RepID=A0AAD2JN11_9STRA|nr:unnamed protein product [Cylindrotheca closterium]